MFLKAAKECCIGCALCLLVIAIMMVFVLTFSLNYRRVSVDIEPGGFFPSKAASICRYYTRSRTCYEYTIGSDDFMQEAKIQQWNLIPIAHDEGKKINCFRFEKYKDGIEITEDFFYDKIVLHGYYEEKEHSLLVYDSDAQRVHFTGSR